MVIFFNLLPIKSYSQNQNNNINFQEEYCIGVIKEIGKRKSENIGDINRITQEIIEVKVKVLSGDYKGKEVLIEHVLMGHPVFDIKPILNKKVVLMIDKEKNKTIFNIADYYRADNLIYQLIIFLLLLIIIGGITGIRAIISLSITISLILFILIPTTLKGYNPIIIAIVVSMISTLITILSVCGFNQKGIGAIIGVIFGFVISGLMSILWIKLTSLSGLSGNESAIMLRVSLGDKVNFSGLLGASMMIGALGAIMDIGVSVSSAIFEVKRANPDSTTIELFKSGMNVGKDQIGTMTNTLVLAYVGTSTPLLLLIISHNINLLKLFNLDMIATEITTAITGSIGLVVTVPLTAIFTSLLFNSKSKLRDKH